MATVTVAGATAETLRAGVRAGLWSSDTMSYPIDPSEESEPQSHRLQRTFLR